MAANIDQHILAYHRSILHLEPDGAGIYNPGPLKITPHFAPSNAHHLFTLGQLGYIKMKGKQEMAYKTILRVHRFESYILTAYIPYDNG